MMKNQSYTTPEAVICTLVLKNMTVKPLTTRAELINILHGPLHKMGKV